jgi:hypothetical protein
LERVQNGINQMANVSEGTQPSFFKPALVLGLPFLFCSSAVAWEVLDGPFGKKYNEPSFKAHRHPNPRSHRERVSKPVQQQAAREDAGGLEGAQDPHHAEPPTTWP